MPLLHAIDKIKPSYRGGEDFLSFSNYNNYFLFEHKVQLFRGEAWKEDTVRRETGNEPSMYL